MGFRNYLARTLFMALLIWGPLDHSWTAWFAIRIGYLILIPLTIWWLLGWIWNHWQLNQKVEALLNRILSGIICVVLFALAILQATSTTHIGNTQWIKSRNGVEAVGDDILLQGPAWGNVFMITIIAMLVLWFGVLKRGAKRANINDVSGRANYLE